MYDIGTVYEPKTVEEAVRMRCEHPQAVIIAGGSDVLIKIREGKLAGADLISIYGLDELRGIHMEEDGTLVIGSLTSFAHITADPLIREHIGVLGEAVDMVGGPQIRAIGTIGGNTCNGVTSADSASTLFAHTLWQQDFLLHDAGYLFFNRSGIDSLGKLSRHCDAALATTMHDAALTPLGSDFGNLSQRHSRIGAVQTSRYKRCRRCNAQIGHI